MTMATERERIQHELVRLRAESERIRAEQEPHEQQRRLEIETYATTVCGAEETLEQMISKERETFVLIDEDERRLSKMKTYVPHRPARRTRLATLI